MAPFATLKLSEKLDSNDWVNQPAQFLEQLSAHLWATQQMDGFARPRRIMCAHSMRRCLPRSCRYHGWECGFGEGVSGTEYKLFRKLRRSGVYFSRLNPETAWKQLPSR